MKRVGVISDTHGLLRPEAVAALAGVDLILHAGDVGEPGILRELERIAPVRAVRGNVDRGPWAERLPRETEVRLGDHTLLMIHVRQALDLDPAAAGYAAVVFGHTHEPLIERHGGVLYFNPGAAGPRRFRLPVTVGELRIEDGRLEASFRELVLDGA